MTKTIHVSYIMDKIWCTREKNLTPKYGEMLNDRWKNEVIFSYLS